MSYGRGMPSTSPNSFEGRVDKMNNRWQLNKDKWNKARKEKRNLKPELYRQIMKEYLFRNPKKAMLYRAKQRAKLLGIEFSLTETDIKIPKICPVLGIILKNKGSSDRDAAPSLDRINSNLGYIAGNVCVISNRANQIKSNATSSELKAVLDYVKRHNL
jgi:hypothetical protein